MSLQAEQDALSRAHGKFGLTREEQRKYIMENIHLLEVDDIKSLAIAIQASKAGDKNAFKRMVSTSKAKLTALQEKFQAQSEGGES